FQLLPIKALWDPASHRASDMPFLTGHGLTTPEEAEYIINGPNKEREMDPKRTAVVLIEYQNDFTSEGGTLHDAVKPVMSSTNMLANTLDTVKKARELGATI